jgi:hypothetical protein
MPSALPVLASSRQCGRALWGPLRGLPLLDRALAAIVGRVREVVGGARQGTGADLALAGSAWEGGPVPKGGAGIGHLRHILLLVVAVVLWGVPAAAGQESQRTGAAVLAPADTWPG